MVNSLGMAGGPEGRIRNQNYKFCIKREGGGARWDQRDGGEWECWKRMGLVNTSAAGMWKDFDSRGF